MTDDDPIARLVAAGIIKEDELTDEHRQVVASLTDDEITALITAKGKMEDSGMLGESKEGRFFVF